MTPRRPYLDAGIDRWKLALVVALFILLLAGALTWYGDAPWSAPADAPPTTHLILPTAV